MIEDKAFILLENRGLIRIEGEARYDFLQKLISQDVALLKKQPSIYSCLLTPQGKFLHDFFVTQHENALCLDCEGGARALDLYRRLKMYCLRTNVQIFIEEQCDLYAVFHLETGGAIPDPRHPKMGFRSFIKPNEGSYLAFHDWDRHRLFYGIPDGSRDMTPEKSTLLECRIDHYNGVSFTKGCYVGQELTARMHHRGLAKKHLYRVKNNTLPPCGTIIEHDGIAIGEMRSSCGDIGLALLKDEFVLNRRIPYEVLDS